jgi:hypothetical protein
MKMAEWRTLVTTKVNKIPDWFQNLYNSGILNGQDGTNGSDGADGTNGVDGTHGVDGHDGVSITDAKIIGEKIVLGMSDGTVLELGDAELFKGEDGVDGKRGPRGHKGDMGKMGIDGKRGRDGKDGKAGKDGKMGPMPKHEVQGTRIRFETAPNKWGEWIQFMQISGQRGGGNLANTYEVEELRATVSLFDRYTSWALGTGLVDIALPGILKTGDTEFSVSAGEGNFLDLSDASNPVLTTITWEAQTGITDEYAETNLRTAVAIDSDGNVVQFPDEITAKQRRDNVLIGLLTHIDSETITQVNLIPALGIDVVGKVNDICEALGFVNLSGNVYSGASSSVNSLAVSAGSSFACDRNYALDKESPNVTLQSADPDISLFFTAYQDGSGGQVVGSAGVVDTTKWDNATGTLADLDNGHWVTHRIYRSTTTGSTLVVYGQEQHKGRVEALTSIDSEVFMPLPGSSELALRGYLSVKKGAAGLQDSATAVFTPSNKYGTGPANRETNGFSTGVPAFKSESFTSRGVSAGTYYVFGDYLSASTDITLTQAAGSFGFGSTNSAYGMRPFAVFAGDGTVDTGQVGLRVTGTTITDGGVRVASDTQVITDDITVPLINAYMEPAKKFIGAVTYELYVVSGSPTTYSVSFNYGFAKYEDFGNRDFMLTDFEITGLAGISDSNVEMTLFKHSPDGWTYAATGFEPGNGEIADMSDIYSVESSFISGEPFNFKLDQTVLNVPITGSTNEGLIVRLVAGQSNTFQIANIHLGVEF